MSSGPEAGFETLVVAEGAAADAFDLLQLARHAPDYYPFLLESSAAEPTLSRFDILFADPGATLSSSAHGLTGPGAGAATFLGALDHWWLAERLAAAQPAAPELPFTGGWFVFLAYELAAEIEPSLQLRPHPLVPLAFATRIPAAVVHDRVARRVSVVSETDGRHSARLQRLARDVRAAPGRATAAPAPLTGRLQEDVPERFLTGVRRAKRYIAAGDNFQTNLSRRWRAQLDAAPKPADLYARLRESNPAPFGGLVQREQFAVLASSPERLVRRRGERLDTRPIAGTYPRNAAGERGADLDLLQNPKERAEHIMLIDLERNDLGRVCRAGTVQVDEYMTVESYAHVHHIVSNVTGVARAGLLPGELLAAVFPGGTITGCPKVRSMDIISELEDSPRGAYTGSMGYLNRSGDLDMNILIRTMTVTGNTLEIAAGSGIVADSVPTRELEETRAKAKGLLLALARPGDRVR